MFPVRRLSVLLTLFVTAAALPALALEDVGFRITGAPDGLEDSLRGASLTQTAKAEDRTDPQEIFAAARSDYGRLLGALYAAGHYSGTISIRIDGREAADIAPLNAPKAIRKVEIIVNPGPVFHFSRAEAGPLAAKTEMPTGFRVGDPALSGTIRDAAEAAVTGWRNAGHAKANIANQSLTADHPKAVLDARIGIAPGPQVRFGALTFTGQQRMKLYRLHKIAGLPEGETYSPEELRKAADRLRRTGVFRSVALTEAETLGPGNTLDIAANISEMPLRRLGFGAEITSSEGATVSAFWLHRNLFGGGERFRIEAEASQIAMKNDKMDWALGLELERPASFTPDTSAILTLDLAREADNRSRADIFSFGFGLRHVFDNKLSGRADLLYSITKTKDDDLGDRTYRNLSLPVGLTWDRRDDAFDPQRGFWIDAELRPFIGFGTTGSGVRGKFDARGYRKLGERVVFAARLQGGFITGSDILETPRDYLFWSGGGGTVRGQPFRALGVDISPNASIGGTRWIGGSLEVRTKVTEKIGAVGFFDYGKVTDATYNAPTEPNWHGGAGLGLRYTTPVGPLRLDVAAPAGGRKGDGVQFYLGIGQAF